MKQQSRPRAALFMQVGLPAPAQHHMEEDGLIADFGFAEQRTGVFFPDRQHPFDTSSQ